MIASFYVSGARSIFYRVHLEGDASYSIGKYIYIYIYIYMYIYTISVPFVAVCSATNSRMGVRGVLEKLCAGALGIQPGYAIGHTKQIFYRL